MFKEGDRVWSVEYGWGEVGEVKNTGYDDITVFFNSDSYLKYRSDGKKYEGGLRVLFFEEIKIPPSALERPRWRAELGEKFYYVASDGEVMDSVETGFLDNGSIYHSGNYFQTEEEAKASKFYKVFHD